MAEAQVKQALEQVYQIRVSLGLPAQPESGHDLSEVPARFGSELFDGPRGIGCSCCKVRRRWESFLRRTTRRPKEVVGAFYKRDPEAKSRSNLRQTDRRGPANQARARRSC